MEKQTITLSISKELYQKATSVAKERGMSISELMVQALEQVLEEDDAYAAAHQRHRKLMAESASLGTLGEIHWPRSKLH